ncbi:MAG: DNA methyltransferase [Cytophagales bacterium]|nr:DNA methyltransferase [Cytophagales bacterium]
MLWCYTGPGSSAMRQFSRKSDNIFWYNKGEKWVFNQDKIRVPHKDGGPHIGGFGEGVTKETQKEYAKKGKIPENWWSKFSPVGRIKKENMGYPTQKPLKLLERIIKASSNKGDWVLDPFCGCATTCVAAENLGRRWVGIDRSELSFYMNYYRLHKRDSILHEGKAPPPIFLIDKEEDFPVREFASDKEEEDYEQRFLTQGKINEIRDKGKKRKPLNKGDEIALKDLLFQDQNMKCMGCEITRNKYEFQLDHIAPKSRGGSDDESNRQLLCGPCNQIKGDRDMNFLWETLVNEGRITRDTVGVLRAQFTRRRNAFKRIDSRSI